MKLLFGKSKWEMTEAPLETFLRRAKADGFDVVEIFLPALSETSDEIRELVSAHGLQLVAQIGTEGAIPADHLASLEKRFAFAAATGPLMINSHTGRDIFAFNENCRILERAIQLAKEANILMTHETHRGRATFAATETRRYLEALQNLHLTADFSHWFCVHESDLSDQPENVSLAIQRARYIHARVGFEEGPQIANPAAPEWQAMTGKFMALWRRIVDARKCESAPFLVITPEFGPPPYMPVEPFTGRPLADAWAVNAQFHIELRKLLA